jgi:hypothetical protein
MALVSRQATIHLGKPARGGVDGKMLVDDFSTALAHGFGPVGVMQQA